MSSREEQFLRVYERRRVDHQAEYYDRRIREFTVIGGRLATIAAITFVLSSAIAVLAALDESGRPALAILTVALPGLSTALAAFNALYGFDRHVKLYGDAARSLARIEPPEPDPDAIATYVESVETVLRTEQGQWGQLAADLSTASQPSGHS